MAALQSNDGEDCELLENLLTKDFFRQMAIVSLHYTTLGNDEKNVDARRKKR
jgi:hypothetical protein